MKVAEKIVRQGVLFCMAVMIGILFVTPLRVKAADNLVMSATPFLLSGQTTTSSYKLMWNHVDGAVNYRLYRDGKVIQDGPANVWSDYDITEKATYQVEALDADNKVLVTSKSVTASPRTKTDDMKYFSYEENPSINAGGNSTIVGANGHPYRYWAYTNGHGGIQMAEQDLWTGATRNVADQNKFPVLADGRTESVNVVQAADGTVTLWAHAEGPSGYTKAAVVSIYGKPGGEFNTKGPFRPLGNQSRDISVYADKSTGEGYLFSATNNNSDLAIYKLTKDFSDIDESFGCVITARGLRREAPAMVKKDGWYYLFSSGTNGWMPTACGYMAARTVKGLADAKLMMYGNSATYGAQSGGVKIWGTETKNYVMCANRWSGQWNPPEPASERCGRFIPLNLEDGIVTGTSWQAFYYNDAGDFIPVSPGKNLSVGKTVTGSNVDGTNTADKAVDGVSDVGSSYFKSTSLPMTLTVDMEQPSIVTLTDALFRNVGGSDGGYSFKVYGSKDNKNWTVLADNTENPLIQIGEKSNFIKDTTPYRYVKLEVLGVTNVINKNSASWANGIVEFTVYGYPEDELEFDPQLSKPIAALEGNVSSLPEKVTVYTKEGHEAAVSVEWTDTKALEKAKAYDTVTVTGKLAGKDAVVTATVEVIPENLIYFIDCGTNSTRTSAAHTAVKESGLAPRLKNEESDATPDGDGVWKRSTGHVTQNGTAADKYTSATGGNTSPISYSVTLEPGVYDVTVSGIGMNAQGKNAKGVTMTATGGTFANGSLVAPENTTVTEQLTVTETNMVTLDMKGAEDGTNAGISFLGIALHPEKNKVSSIKNGELWYDDQENVIQGHGGNILVHGGRYYWVGEYKNNANFSGIALYSSDDLMNWKFENMILTPETPDEDGTIGFCTIERPKLIYNEKTKEFVLWAHWENGKNYSESKLIVAKSKTVNGDYEFVKRFNPLGNRSLDFTIYNDTEAGQAYIVSASGHNMWLYPLTEDYLDVKEEGAYLFFENQGREAPALVKAGDYYVFISSGQSGWYPNQSMYSYTKDITDPAGWSELKNIGNNSTFYSQPTNIAVIGNQYVYMGDRWKPGALGNSTYVWLPLNIQTSDNGVELSMKYIREWAFDVASHEFTVPQSMLLSEGRTVKVSSTGAEGHGAEQALDGIDDTDKTWGNNNYYKPSSDTLPFTYEIDLGGECDLSGIDLATRLCNGSEAYYQYIVEGSNDRTEWTKILDESQNTVVGFRSNAVSGSYRYVRLTVTGVKNVHNNNSAMWASGLVEVKVYGTPKVLADFDFDDETSGFTSVNANAAGAHALQASYNKANGKALYLDGTAANFLTVTDKNGGSLLTGSEELTISFEAKPDSTATNWLFYAAPNEKEQSYQKENYIGVLMKGGTITAERYKNNGSRPQNPSAAVGNSWTKVDIVVRKDKTEIYINGIKQSEMTSTYSLSDILGDNSILYIGKANWGTGEYYKGLIDNYKIISYAMTADQIKAAMPQDIMAELEALEITAPTKMQYEAGEDLNLDGMKVAAKYSDGTTEEVPVEDCKISGYDKNKVGKQTVTVTYEGAQAVFTVTVKEKEEPIVPERPFVDVDKDTGEWYYDAVYYNYDRGIIQGVDKTHFEPTTSLERGQFAVMLYRMNDMPEVSYEEKFKDVASGNWYTDAIMWTAGTGVVTGYADGSGTFGPADKILREQMAVMMYRYAQFKGCDVSESAEFSKFTDAASVSGYAKDAMAWAVGAGILTGKDGGTKLDPQGEASRAECAVILKRFLEKYAL